MGVMLVKPAAERVEVGKSEEHSPLNEDIEVPPREDGERAVQFPGGESTEGVTELLRL